MFTIKHAGGLLFHINLHLCNCNTSVGTLNFRFLLGLINMGNLMHFRVRALVLVLFIMFTVHVSAKCQVPCLQKLYEENSVGVQTSQVPQYSHSREGVLSLEHLNRHDYRDVEGVAPARQLNENH